MVLLLQLKVEIVCSITSRVPCSGFQLSLQNCIKETKVKINKGNLFQICTYLPNDFSTQWSMFGHRHFSPLNTINHYNCHPHNSISLHINHLMISPHFDKHSRTVYENRDYYRSPFLIIIIWLSWYIVLNHCRFMMDLKFQ